MTQRRKGSGVGVESITDLLAPTLKRMGVHGAVRDAQVGEVFAEIVGPALAPMCQAMRIERGAVVVVCANSALAQQLHLESPRIIATLNDRLGADVARRLRFASS